ncbi:hypothetical protein [Arthrobacter sp. TB 23]|uniref:hypothetical protein n=1 Tax=Arthrobacter sp. TB 23 TaxID=494419 RepID=UPI0002EC58A3|nr:hypothetical protein [Arthrobacter sp. TB 23]
MPTFHNPLADAAEASEALRGLAHASLAFDNPADTYAVLSDLTSGVRSLRQVLDQLANAHLAHRGRAHDDHGDHPSGADRALAASDELHQAGTLLDQVHDRLDTAFGHAGRIAWHPDPALDQEPLTKTATRRWVSVVFLQGEDADEVLDLIDRDGAAAAIEHLKGFDYGYETTVAALENGYVYDEPPSGALDRSVTADGYTLTSNAAMGHVSLLRQHTVLTEDALPEPGTATARETSVGHDVPVPNEEETAAPRVRRAPDPSWFEQPGFAGVKQSRGLSL